MAASAIFCDVSMRVYELDKYGRSKELRKTLILFSKAFNCKFGGQEGQKPVLTNRRHRAIVPSIILECKSQYINVIIKNKSPYNTK